MKNKNARELFDKKFKTKSLNDLSDFMISGKSAISLMEEFAEINQDCIHEFKTEHDKRYPYRPLRCQKCGYEP